MCSWRDTSNTLRAVPVTPGVSCVKVAKLRFDSGKFCTSVVAIVFLVFIIGLIGYFPTTRVSLYAGLVWVVLLLAGYWFKVNRQKKRALLATQQD